MKFHLLILRNYQLDFEFNCSLTITVIAVNGGYRKLKTPTTTIDDYFIGQSSQKSMMFRFDFRKPHHCLLDGPCSSKAFTVDNDVTKVTGVQ